MEYDEPARACVTHEDSTRRFTLFADRCIIKSKRMASRIMGELRLPKNTMALPDHHYRCPGCIRKPDRK